MKCQMILLASLILLLFLSFSCFSYEFDLNISKSFSEEEKKFNEERNSLIQNFQRELNILENKASILREKADFWSKYKFAIQILLPMVKYISRIIIFAGFPLFLLNILLYLKLKEKSIWQNRQKRLKIEIIILVIEMLIIFSFLSNSSLAAEQERPIIKKLNEISILLTYDELDLTIYKLENLTYGEINIPSFKIGDHLYNFEQISANTPEHFFSLGSLYWKAGNWEKAYNFLAKSYEETLLKRFFLNEIRLNMFTSLVKFYVSQNKIEEASKLLELIMGYYKIGQIIEMLDFLEGKGMQNSQSKLIEKAIDKVKTPQALIDLGNILIKINRKEFFLSAFEIIPFIQFKDKDFLPIIKMAVSEKMEKFTADFIDKMLKEMTDINELLKASLYFKEINRLEDSRKFMDKAIKLTTNPETLITIAKGCFKLEYYSLAAKCIIKIFDIHGPDYALHTIDDPKLLTISKYAPVIEPIILSTFLGIIEQLQKNFEKAKAYYEEGIIQKLDRIIQNGTIDIDPTILDYFYLYQFFVETNDKEGITALKPVYNHLVKLRLNSLKKEHKLAIEEIKNKQNRKLKEMQEDIANYEQQLSQLRKSFFSSLVNMLINFLILLSFLWILIIALFRAGRYALRLSRSVDHFKTWAFYFKFLECLGWILIMFVIPCLAGLFIVLWGQSGVKASFILQYLKRKDLVLVKNNPDLKHFPEQF